MLNKLSILAFAARLAPGLLQVRRGTWIALAVTLALLFVLLIWAAVAMVTWLFGQAQGVAGMAREAAVEPARSALEQVERVVPGVREQVGTYLGGYLPAQGDGAVPARDVSGEDLGPVARPAGLVRTGWQRDGARAAVEYLGQADYHAVLEHYVRGFASLGFAQTVLNATPEAETHEYAKGAERYRVGVMRKGRDKVNVRVEAGL